MESWIEEIDGDSDTLICWHGDEDGKGIILNGKSVDLGPGSSLSELGICTAREDETTPVEDETSLTFLGMTNDRLGVFDEGEAMPKDKASNLIENDGDLERYRKLGFGGAPLTTNNGGRREVSFNMSEFIKFAHTVIDADDHASLTALEELKTKWETRFGKDAAAKSFPATSTLTEPPLVRGFRQALRNTLPPILGEKSMGNRATVRTRILPVRTKVTGDNGGRTAAEKMNGELRPEIHGGAAFPSHDKEVKSADAIADVGADTAADVGVDYAAYVGADSDDDITAELSMTSALQEKNCNFGTKLAPIPLFIGNIPLHANANMINNDKIADAFNNSSRKTLSFIAPTTQNGEVVVRPTIDTVREGSKRWKATTVGYFYGKTAMLSPLEGVCTFGFASTSRGLSIVASGVGKPLYPDAITRACTRLDFARVCVMIDVTQKLQNHIIIMTPDEDGGETPCKIDIEYEWLPPKCTGCMALGHSVKECTSTKPQKQTKPPIKVYVPKTNVLQPPAPKERQKKRETMVEVNDATRGDKSVEHDECEPSYHKEKGKEVIIYNPFDTLNLIDDAEETTRDYQLAVKDLVSEYRLHFMGILDTRVQFNNIMHIQSFLLPHWKWFVDYVFVGNRIWVTWDDNVVDVHILELGNQFVHCRVTNRADSESLTITVVYGASKMIDLREINEVCGVSGDIRTAMEEFNAAIQEAGLIPLPMQGEWYTWHNCSTSSRSLWKRLDRILINDRWLARFPSSCYHSLVPRTSDYSPLVLQGDRQHHQQTGGGMFRFDNYLTHSLEFIPSVQNIWQHTIIGVPMFVVTRKLKALKSVFREQRRKKGDLTLNVQLAKGFLDEAQQLVSDDRQNEALFIFFLVNVSFIK
ncbi:UNVERIFIED_CONTAM: hypothetical protein Sindi_2313900 [Sesamum indicum]